MISNKYPLDFDELEKGDVISTDIIEDAMGTKATDRNFNFKMLALAAMIEKQTGFNVKAQNYTELRILTDEEGVEHNAKTFQHGLNKLRRAGQIARNVNPEQLTSSSMDRLQRQMLNQGRIMQAIKRERRQIANDDKAKQLTNGVE